MFLLDTNVVSELRRPETADPRVLAWASAAPVASVFLSSITVLELELGVRLAERKDAVQGSVLRAWLDGSSTPGRKALPVVMACSSTDGGPVALCSPEAVPHVRGSFP